MESVATAEYQHPQARVGDDRNRQHEADPEATAHVGFHRRGHARVAHIVARMGHPRVLRVRGCLRLRRLCAVLEPGRMRVMVRRDCRIRRRDRAATTTARSGDFGELFDGHHPHARFDVRNAPCGVNVHADDVRIFP
jgi:hypothetical protein